jgi:hypothetical protein
LFSNFQEFSLLKHQPVLIKLIINCVNEILDSDCLAFLFLFTKSTNDSFIPDSSYLHKFFPLPLAEKNATKTAVENVVVSSTDNLTDPANDT